MEISGASSPLSFSKIARLATLASICILIFSNGVKFCTAQSSEPTVTDLQLGSVLLSRHSIGSSFLLQETLEDWDVFGAAIPTHNKNVVLTPAVADKRGGFWSRVPLLTDTFEVEFTYEIRGNLPVSRSQGFAFWYVTENVAAARASSTESSEIPKDWSLLGYKPNFEGLGVFFAHFDREGRYNPSISAGLGDGKQLLNSLTDIPTGAGVYWKIRESPEPLMFKLSVGPKGILGQSKSKSATSWTHSFKISHILPAGGFLGFSADSGPEGSVGTPEDKLSDLISVGELSVWNLDLNQQGEAPLAPAVKAEGSSDGGMQDLLRVHSEFKDQRQVADAIRSLTKVMIKFAMEAVPREQSMAKHLSNLSAHLSKLSQDVIMLQKQVAESQQGAPQSASADHVEAVAHEIRGLKGLFSAQSDMHAAVAQKLHHVDQKIDKVDRAAAPGVGVRQLANIERTLQKQANLSSYMTIALIVTVVLFGLYMWKRMRDMEKKHLF